MRRRLIDALVGPGDIEVIAADAPLAGFLAVVVGCIAVLAAWFG
jgi:hypothetical protein